MHPEKIIRQQWHFTAPRVCQEDYEAIRACVRAQDGRVRAFLCEIPADDGEGRFPPVTSCTFLAEESLLILHAAYGPAGPRLRCLMRWNTGHHLFYEEAPGLYRIESLSLVQVV
jgi:hypothetical protein